MATWVGIGTTDPGDDIKVGNNKVGIGTTSPAALLSVVGGDADIGNGPAQFLNNLTDAEWKNYNFLVVGKEADDGQAAMFGYHYSDTEGNEGAFVSVHGDDINSLFVRNGGNVGIGITAPVNKLDITGATAIGLSYAGTAAPSDGLIIQGNVGIGTTSPGTIDSELLQLDVHGYGGFNGLRVGLDGANDIESTSANGLNITSTDANGKMNFKTGGNSAGNIRMTIDGSGKIGLGYQWPANKLDVAGATAIGSSYAGTAAPADGLIVSGNMGIGTTAPQDNLHVVYPYDKTDTSERFAFEVSSNDSNARHGLKISSIGHASDQSSRKYLIQSHEAGVSNNGILSLQPYGGNVGVGTTSPANKLSVVGTADISGSVGIGTTSPANKLSVAGAADISGNVGIGTTSPANKLSVAGSVDISGNVGVGTTSPVSVLEVNGVRGSGGYSGQIMVTGNNDHGYIQVRSTNPSSKETGIGFIGNESINTPEWIVKIPANSDDLRFNNKGTDRMALTSSGSVGIGTMSPGQKLEVNGNIKASGYIVGSDSGIDATINYQKYPSGNGTLVFKKGILTSAT
jgi:hypothetical protein